MRPGQIGCAALDHADYRAVEKTASSDAQVGFNTIVPRGVAACLEQRYDSGITARRLRTSG